MRQPLERRDLFEKGSTDRATIYGELGWESVPAATPLHNRTVES